MVTPGYPSKNNPYYPFVGLLCEEFAKQGKSVTVVCPQSLFSKLKRLAKPRPIHCVEDGNGLVDVYRPYYFTLPYQYKRINNYLFRKCLSLFLKSSNNQFDVYYCHFWQAGYNAYRCIKGTGKPLFVATGESEIGKMYEMKNDNRSFCNYLKGVVAVSTKNRDDSIAMGLTTTEKCKIIPNAVSSELFHKLNQTECRKKIGASQKDFIIIFVGWFIERKGPQRVANAIKKVGGVKSVFIGKGEQEPQCDDIIFKGPLPHEEIPVYLGAADVFVLPTQHEGCCNAVVEAMACGLPVISSNRSFNWDVLDETNSIMVDPDNVDDIASAIKELRDNKSLRETLSKGALKKAEKLTIENRARAIIEFMETMKY